MLSETSKTLAASAVATLLAVGCLAGGTVTTDAMNKHGGGVAK
jgi:hypothetical protein